MLDFQYRLVTRSDFDGLICAALLKEMNLINEVKFVNPKEMQDGVIAITSHDITTNLPFVEACQMAFDHHASEMLRLGGRRPDNYIVDPDAPSTARVIYDYFGGAEMFSSVSREMMEAVDRADSAQFTTEEVLEPTGWALINFIMDSRTGLGRYKRFRISNRDLMMQLIDHCREHHDPATILELPDVKERVDFYRDHAPRFKEQLERCARVEGDVVLVDLRGENEIYVGNRFMVYALFPGTKVSIHVLWGLNARNTVLAMGKSIFDRSATTHIGELCLMFGGGGHAGAGTCQIANDQADGVLREVLDLFHADQAVPAV